MTTLESVHHPEWTSRIAFIAWIALLVVELAVHGTDLFIMGSDAGPAGGFAFASIALVMLTVKALAWSSDWNELGWLFAIIGVLLMLLFASAIYDLAQPLPSEVVHSSTYDSVAQQLATNNTQLSMIDLSKESRLALLASNESLTAQLAALNTADLEALKPRLTLRSMFESIASMPAAPIAKWLCVVFFGLIGVGLEVANFRITPRRSAIASSLPRTEPIESAYKGGFDPRFYQDRLSDLDRMIKAQTEHWVQKTTAGQTPRPESNDNTETKEQTSDDQKETIQPEPETEWEETERPHQADLPDWDWAHDDPIELVAARDRHAGPQSAPQAEADRVVPEAPQVRSGDAESPASATSGVRLDPGPAFSFPLTGDQLRKFAHMMLRRYPVLRTIDETIEKNPHVPRDVLVALYQKLTSLEHGQVQAFRWDGQAGHHVANFEKRILDKMLKEIA